MYGRRVHEAVVAAGERQSGATVHLVDDQYDHGAVVAQVATPLSADDTPETVERKVTALEPGLFVATLKAIVAGELALPPAG
jgi:phosphoribosylglycinamide formyltransferase-1